MPDQYVHTEEIHGTGAKYLGDLVYGANDGIITTFAIVSGAAGAALSPGIIIILGIANLVADGISMGLSNYLAIRSKHDYHRKQRKKEEWEVEHFPDKERHEVYDILLKWGVPQKHMEETLDAITSDKKRWVDLMMREELNLYEDENESPARHGLATLLAFVVAGSMPLLSYFFGIPNNLLFPVSIIATVIALFTVGALRTLVTSAGWFRSGFEMLIVGTLASGAAYILGFLIKTTFGITL